MKNLTYNLEFYSDWHCGSGLSSGGDVDSLVVKDRNDMPYVPGKTIKGLVREAVEAYCALLELNVDIVSVFGLARDRENVAGTAFFSNAAFDDCRYAHIVKHSLQSYLYRTVSSTRIGDDGIAKDTSLRKTETVVPCALEGSILNVSDEMADVIIKAAGFIKRLGLDRTRGMGRCKMTVKVAEPEPKKDKDWSKEPSCDLSSSTVRKFRCTLLTDVVLSQKSASEGNSMTLDFIPGSNFLGIVAAHYDDFKEKALDVFHSGKVRFSDAHPSIGGRRSLYVPASFFMPKLVSDQGFYLHHATDHSQEEIKALQLKQCRKGFYVFLDNIATQVSTFTSFAIKSAYDREMRKSKDEQMYGFQSMAKGVELYFSVESEDVDLLDTVCDYLIGEKRIGKSRSSQYGLVKIESFEYSEVTSTADVITVDGNKYAAVYADGRLIFMDRYGVPTCLPRAEDLGLKGEIDWAYSQVRTFQYAPWNGKRQCFDADRFGVEKGSVFLVKLEDNNIPVKTAYVGAFKGEGFGKVIYNPDFLTRSVNGKSVYVVNHESEVASAILGESSYDWKNDQFMVWLHEIQDSRMGNIAIYEAVNEWKAINSALFMGESFASQWGNIRTLAATSSSYEELEDKLFAENVGYLVHGVAKDKWDKYDRALKLKEFIEAQSQMLSDVELCRCVVNLATEMAKLN